MATGEMATRDTATQDTATNGAQLKPVDRHEHHPDARPLAWDLDGAHWPNHEHSRFVNAGGLRWHVQVMGRGPVILLVHGTGATTHSWRDMAPLLAHHFTVVAPDLPGHGFTGQARGRGMSLPGMAEGIHALLGVLHLAPVIGIGHSAGAAVVAQMCLAGTAFSGLVSLNGAFLPIAGARVFSPLAKVLARSSLVPRIFARRAREHGVVESLLKRTGSSIDESGKAQYARLARDAGHVGGALAMMANWDLHALREKLSRLHVPLLLVVGSEDRTIVPAEAFTVRDLVSGSRVDYLRGVGHLAHEERPQEVVNAILRFAYDIAALE